MKLIKIYLQTIFFIIVGFNSDNIVGQSGWSLLNEKPTTNDLNDIAPISKDISIIVGNRGAILKTTNGGVDWALGSINNNSDLKSINFINTTTGWIVASNGGIHKTIDQGQTWSEQLVYQWGLNSVFFVDSLYGWTVGDAGTILHTQNGGADWIVQNENFGNTMHTVYFVNRDTGWAGGRFMPLYKTTNGGEDWEEDIYPNICLKIQFIDQNYGWFLSDGPFDYLYYTSNGGQDWHQRNLPTDYSKNFFFLNNNMGWLVGSEGIYKTTDGGNSWSTQMEGVGLKNINMIDSVTGWSVGNGGFVLKTDNGGEIWEEQAQGIDYDFKSVQFVDDVNGWAISNNRYLIHSTDSGEHWGIIYDFDSLIITSLSFINVNTGWVIGYDQGFNPYLYKTTNNGQSWQLLSNNPLLLYSTELLYSDINTGWILSEGSGSVLKTTNGGLDWETVLNDNTFLSDMHVFNSQNLIIAGGDPYYNDLKYGIIYKTSDGGNTWVSQIHQDIWREGYRTVYFINEEIGFLYGEGKLKKSFDGGDTWDIIYEDSDWVSFLTMYFQNDSLGWSLGSSVLTYPVMNTTDGGLNWNFQNIPPTDSKLHGVHFVNLKKGYIFGENGYLIKTTSGGEIITTIEENDYQDDIISDINLFQNYPNPFNSGTTIKYAITENGLVTLKVYDILGREVAILVNENMEAGNYSVIFNASYLPSGIYFYKISSGNHPVTKKLVLLK